MVDVNERALELAKENAANNNVENIRIFQSNVYEKVDGQYAAILSNPPIRAGKHIVHEILGKAFDHLVPGGELWIVIQKKQGAPSALKKLEETFAEVEIVEKKKGYYIIKSKKTLTVFWGYVNIIQCQYMIFYVEKNVYFCFSWKR